MSSETLKALESAASNLESGASEIESELVDRLLKVRGTWRLEDLLAGARRLRDSKSAMANLAALARGILDSGDLALVERLITERQLAMMELPRKLAENAGPLLSQCGRLVTLSRSAAVASVILGIKHGGWDGEVVVLDGSPCGRGPDQAERLARAGVVARSQPDATATGWLEDRQTAIGVVIGADAMSEQRFVNASGSRAVLELAERRQLDRVVVAESIKLVDDARLDAMVLTQQTASEPVCGRSWSPLEVVPRSLVSVWVSERGVQRSADDGWRQK